MARYLSVVERAYRATVEEQDDTAVWFTLALRAAGAEVGLLLRGDAVNYAVRGQNAGGLRFGTQEVRVPPELDKDLAALMQRGVRVYAVSDDLSERGIAEGELSAGVERVTRARLGHLCDDYDRVLHW